MIPIPNEETTNHVKNSPYLPGRRNFGRRK
jgi:hypothetical protein